MSRVTKWKLEKAKVKVVFRLQFHVTHIPQSGWDKLYVSFIPVESGKATAKTTKANVRNGTCKWGDPIYETTRLLFDAKTKQYDDKLYKLVIGMGSSRSSLLGEATINLADYADASKPSTVTLPLNGCNFGTILHVTVQLLTSKTGFREFEQQREFSERGLPSAAGQNSHVESSGVKVSSSEETVNDQIDKVHSTRVTFKTKMKELPSLEEGLEVSEEYADSGAGFDGSSNTSESLYAEKQDTSSTHEMDSLKSTISGDLGGNSQSQSPRLEKGDPNDHRFFQSWGSDNSMDNELAISCEENTRLRGSLEAAESSIFELKLEVSSLQSHADAIGVETGKVARELAAEIASGEELTKEVSVLRSECSKCKDDLEQLKNSKSSAHFANRELIELMEDKLKVFQNKASLRFHEGDFRFLNSDLEALLGVLQDLKEGTGQGVSELKLASQRTNLTEVGNYVSGSGFDADLYHEPHSIEVSNVMQVKMFELLKELDESKAERESLATKMDQMECYYEALIQELEENQKQILAELQNLRNEHSTCIYTISSNKAQMEIMHREMNEQILRFSDDRRNLESLTEELERRAVTSEAALKRARLNYSVAVDQLQKDLELLSFQVLSVFETNESLIRQDFGENSLPGLHGYAGRVQKQPFGGDVLLGDLKRSLHSQEELYRKVEEELCEMQLLNLQVDVFSKILLETLREANSNIALMRERVEHSTESEELLRLRLQAVMDDVHTLNDHKATCIAKCNELIQRNQFLEANLESVSCESHHLTQKLAEQERLMIACVAENSDLENLVRHKSLENGGLRNDISSLQQQMKIVKSEFDKLASVNENLLKTVNFSQHKLRNLLVSHDNKFNQVSRSVDSPSRDLDFEELTGVILQLEEKIHQLREDNKNLEEERDSFHVSLNTAESEILSMGQKFQKLQLELGAYSEKLKLKSEDEAKHAQENKELVSNLAILEAELQKVTSHNRSISQEILVLTNVSQELERSKLTISELTRENQDLEASLGHKSDESVKLSSELSCLKESLNEKHNQLLHLDQQKTKLYDLLSLYEQYPKRFDEASSSIIVLEIQLAEMHEGLISADVMLIFSRVQYETRIEELVWKLQSADRHIEEICKKHLDVEYRLSSVLASNTQYIEDNARLLSTIELVRSELEASVAENKVLLDSNAVKEHHVEENARLLTMLESTRVELEASVAEKRALLESNAVNVEENSKLLTALESVRSELEASVAENKVLLDSNAAKMQYVEENARLLKTLESVRSELEASVAENKVLLDSNAAKTQYVEDSARLLTTLESVRSELEASVAENKVLLDSNAAKTHYVEENARLLTTLESVRSELKASVAENKVLLDSNAAKTLYVEENARLLTTLESVRSELEASTAENKVLLDSNATAKMQYFEENARLLTTLESLRNGLEASVVENKVLLDSNAAKTQYVEENARLLTTLESVRSELEASVAENSSLLDSNAVNIEENSKLLTALESMRSELEASVAENKVLLDSNTAIMQHVEENARLLTTLESLRSGLEASVAENKALFDSNAAKTQYVEENARLLTTLESVRSELEAAVAENRVLSDSNARLFMTLESVRSELKSSVDENKVLLESNAVETRCIEENARLLTLLESVRSKLEASVVENRALSDSNARLLTMLESVKSNFEASVKENGVILDSNTVAKAQVEEYEKKTEILEIEVEELKRALARFEEDSDETWLSMVELDFCVVFLKANMDEQQALIVSLEERSDNMVMWQDRCKELNKRLSEQTLKTEEFKNLSIHLKELKDKAESERPREPEGPSESLRMVFIKEQCETKVQELGHQLLISKKHAEEMLMKLQDAVDEVENRKKSEASHLKKNEELSLKILELEGELQSALLEKREKIMAFDEIKAELECTSISLECSKEEKEKLEASLQECCEEKSRIAVELTLVKKLLESSAPPQSVPEEGHGRVSKDTFLGNGSGENPSSYNPMGCEEAEDALASTNPLQDFLASKDAHVISRQAIIHQEDLHSGTKDLSFFTDHFKSQCLKSSMDHLHKELERMKNENLLLPEDDHYSGPNFEGPQRELLQLHKVNEELGSIFPLFNAFSSNGNALERVLALEIELAEALRAKKKPNFHFQSSFLKQHSDEEAIFQSFRDINELIRDMLELKGRYVTVETELKEMHERYSQLSVQFAEVEGEREKLTMTLKNVRSSKKIPHLYRFKSPTFEDHSP